MSTLQVNTKKLKLTLTWYDSVSLRDCVRSLCVKYLSISDRTRITVLGNHYETVVSVIAGSTSSSTLKDPQKKHHLALADSKIILAEMKSRTHHKDQYHKAEHTGDSRSERFPAAFATVIRVHLKRAWYWNRLLDRQLTSRAEV